MTTKRGTTNGNARGGSDARRRRREWLVASFPANMGIVRLEPDGFPLEVPLNWIEVENFEHACRCYRCGTLLTVYTVTVDRIIPGCQGGTYRRNNIRPACGPCNSETGGATRGKVKR